MKARMSAILLVLVAVATAKPAAAELTAHTTGARPTGFALEVDLVGSTTVLGETIGVGGFGMHPRLFLGGQLGRFSIGGVVSMDVLSRAREGRDDLTYWSVSLGPALDYEVWTSGPGAIYIGGALPVQVASDDSTTTSGFGFDFRFGGRLWVGRWLAVDVGAGSRLDVLFWGNDRDEVRVGWSLYGALGLRFVASR